MQTISQKSTIRRQSRSQKTQRVNDRKRYECHVVKAPLAHAEHAAQAVQAAAFRLSSLSLSLPLSLLLNSHRFAPCVLKTVVAPKLCYSSQMLHARITYDAATDQPIERRLLEHQKVRRLAFRHPHGRSPSKRPVFVAEERGLTKHVQTIQPTHLGLTNKHIARAGHEKKHPVRLTTLHAESRAARFHDFKLHGVDDRPDRRVGE